jgi:hypothetical protein
VKGDRAVTSFLPAFGEGGLASGNGGLAFQKSRLAIADSRPAFLKSESSVGLSRTTYTKLPFSDAIYIRAGKNATIDFVCRKYSVGILEASRACHADLSRRSIAKPET